MIGLKRKLFSSKKNHSNKKVIYKHPEHLNDPEFIGRALYSKGSVYDVQKSVKWHHFYDSRLETDLSVDVIGNGGIESKRIKYLHPRALSRKDHFKGWAAIKVKNTRQKKLDLMIYRDPINNEDPTKANKFHAQIDRGNFRTEQLATMLAIALSHLTSEVVPPPETS